MIWAPQFRRWTHQNVSNDLNSLLTILQPCSLSISPDVRYWKFKKFKQSGPFTINSLYRSLIGCCEENNCFRYIWTIQTPFKTKVHTWLSFHDRLLTTENLSTRGFISHRHACFVGQIQNLSLIFFFSAPSPWNFGCRKDSLAPSSWPSSIASLWGGWWSSNIPHNELDRWVVTASIGIVWQERNQRVFKGKSTTISELVGRVSSLVTLWWSHFSLHKCRKSP